MGLVESGVLLDRGGVQIVSSLFLKKSMFSLLLEYFFLSGKYWHVLLSVDLLFQVVYFLLEYDILWNFFPLTLIFKNNLGKFYYYWCLFPFQFHSKLQIFLKINYKCLKEVIAQLLYIMIFIIMNLKFK